MSPEDAPCSCGFPSRSACHSLFEEVIAREFSDYRYGRIHRLTVDAYCLQHPDPYMRSAKSFAAHLTGMYCALELGGDRKILRRLQQWLSTNPNLKKPRPPAEKGSIHIDYVAAAQDAEDHERRVRRWAEDIWQAYRAYHDLARRWTERARREIRRAGK